MRVFFPGRRCTSVENRKTPTSKQKKRETKRIGRSGRTEREGPPTMSKIWQGKSDEGRRGREGGRTNGVKYDKVSGLCW